MERGDSSLVDVVLVEGPVGAGKSTYAGRLAFQRSALFLNLDEWMVTLFRPDRPEADFLAWYAERKERCVEQIWLVAEAAMLANQPVILELGLVQHLARAAFYERLSAAQVEYEVHVLDAPSEERLARVRQRNRERGTTYQMDVSDEVFRLANGAWEAPDETELSSQPIRFA